MNGKINKNENINATRQNMKITSPSFKGFLDLCIFRLLLDFE